MSETHQHENELLRRLEFEYAEQVATGATHDALRPLRSLITRIRTRLDSHITEVPKDMRRHPALKRLKEKIRKDRGQL